MKKPKKENSLPNSATPLPQKKSKLGRPTKFEPRFCEMLLDHMREGKSFETFGPKIGVESKTLYNWCDSHPSFLQAKNRAFDLCRAWWEDKSQELLSNTAQGERLNAPVWIFNMKNRFGWTDKTEETGHKTINVNVKPIHSASDALYQSIQITSREIARLQAKPALKESEIRSLQGLTKTLTDLIEQERKIKGSLGLEQVSDAELQIQAQEALKLLGEGNATPED